MPRQKEYANAATKQAAYRERKKEQAFKAKQGHNDRELGRALRDLYATMQHEAERGNSLAALLLRDTPADTLEAVRLHLFPPTFRPF